MQQKHLIYALGAALLLYILYDNGVFTPATAAGKTTS